jgi:hypothetical protein
MASSAALRGAPPGRKRRAGSLQLGARVDVALDEVAASLRRQSRGASRLLLYAAAAGIALVAVALGHCPAGTWSAPMAVAVQPAIQPVTWHPCGPVTGGDRVGGPGQPSLSPRRLTSYLVYHGEYSGMLSAKLTDPTS